MLVGNLVHKAPESVVLGLLLHTVTQKPIKAAGWAVFASVFLVIGGAAQRYTASFHSQPLLMGSLAFAAAGFLFVGFICFAPSAGTMDGGASVNSVRNQICGS